MREGGGVSHAGEWAAGLLGEKKEKKEEKGQDLKKIIIL